MKVIDLLNKIANGEEVPRKFTYKGYLWEYDINNEMWFYYFGEGKNHRFDRLFYLNMCLNDEIEIIEEDKPIEELLIEQDCPSSNYYIRNEFGTKCGLTKHSKMIAEKVNEIAREVNKLKKKENE